MANTQRLFTEAFQDIQCAVDNFCGSNYPLTDVIEHAENFTLESELPGYTKNNIKFELVDNRTLVLSGSINDDTFESNYPLSDDSKDIGGSVYMCKAHGEYTDPTCKACGPKLEKSEEIKEPLSQQAQSIKLDKAQVAQEKAKVDTFRKEEKPEHTIKDADVKAPETQEKKSIVEKAKDAFNTQAKKLESNVKMSDSEQEKKTDEAEVEVKKEEPHTKSEESQVQNKKAKHIQEKAKAIPEEIKRPQRAQYLIKERNPAGSFSRAYTFPTHINADGIKARFEDGILKAIVPKLNINKHQKINIE